MTERSLLLLFYNHTHFPPAASSPVPNSWQPLLCPSFLKFCHFKRAVEMESCFLKNLEIELPYDPAIPLLGIHTEETRRERDTCTPMFIAALFIIARTWKKPRCPSAEEWVRKLWYIYRMEYYSDIKKNTFESVLMRWMQLKSIIQSEVSQKEKNTNTV